MTIDLDALERNYRRLLQAAAPGACGATVKANAYGLGAAPVVERLRSAGCRHFFVATYDEALAIRVAAGTACIYVLGGLPAGLENEALRLGIRPVVNEAEQLERWTAALHRVALRRRAPVQIDTGMGRLGFDPREITLSATLRRRLAEFPTAFWMTHLACADDPAHPLNRHQVEAFGRVLAHLPQRPTSIGNSAGTLLGAPFCGDIARPGLALYGGNPFEDREVPLDTVVRLHGHVLQVRAAEAGDTVGYGGAHRVERSGRIATIQCGYADGFPRAAWPGGAVAIQGVRVPIVGRVSMDAIMADISALPEAAVGPGTSVEIIGDTIGLRAFAAQAGTIEHEALARLGRRLHRHYLGRTTATRPSAGAPEPGCLPVPSVCRDAPSGAAALYDRGHVTAEYFRDRVAGD
ncbi:MAG TPA: alanine racemase [Azospirillaceae bacterium]|nr:alanine racemase [Azospirillaceae bacterium]